MKRLSLLTFLLMQAVLQAAPPANDNKASAQGLSGTSATSSISNVEATAEVGDFANRTIWWTWTAPASGLVTLDTINSPAKFLRLKVFLEETAGVAGGIIGEDQGDLSTEDPKLSFIVSQGTRFLIGVGNTSTSTNDPGVITLALNLDTTHSSGQLTYTGTSTLVNDAFASRITLSGNEPNALTYNASATREAGEPATTGSATFWWTYRPSSNGILRVSSQGSAAMHKSVNVFMGSNLSSLRLVDGESPSLSSDQADFDFPVTKDTDYQISFGVTSGSRGAIVLSLRLDTNSSINGLNIPNAVTMANDNFAARVSLAGNSVGAIAYNSSGSNEAGEPTYSGGRTFWWTYRPQATGMLNISSQGTDSMHKAVAVYFGENLAGLRLVAGQAPSNATHHVALQIPVTAGIDYQISFGTQSSTAGTVGSVVLGLVLDTSASFASLNIPLPATNSNDNFANRVALPGNTVSAIGYNVAATREPLEPAGDAGTGEHTLWWSWTAANSGQGVIDFTGSILPHFNYLRLRVYTGTSFSTLSAISAVSGGATYGVYEFQAGVTYQIAAGSNAAGYAGSLVMTVTGPDPVPQAPNFTQQPTSKWVAVGSTLQLSSATDDPGADMQWRQDEANILGATAANLSRPITALTQAGIYDVNATNDTGTTPSEEALVGVMTSPAAQISLAEGGKLTLALTAKAPTAISYRWRRNGVPLSDGKVGLVTTAGSGTASLSITGVTSAEAGSYTCALSMVNPANAAAPIVGISSASTVTVLLKPVVDNMTVPAAAVSQPFSWQLTASQSPTAFIVSGLPSGLTVNLTTGLVTGVPNAKGTAKVRVSAKNVAGTGLVKEFILNITELLPGLFGSYSGLVDRSEVFNASLGGTVNLTLTISGSFTGSLKLGTVSVPFKGRVLTPSGAPSTTEVMVTINKVPTKLTFDFTPAQGIIAGTLESTLGLGQFEARRNDWTRLSPPTDWAGLYNSTLALPNLSNLDELPRGMGYLQMTVNGSSGAVTITGKTGDGTSYTSSSLLRADGRIPLFALMYSNKGSLLGMPQILLAGDLDNTVTGALDWLKNGPTSTADKLYASGFEALPLEVEGSKWVKPITGSMLFDLPNQADNARIEFSEADIETAEQADSVSQTFQITSTHTTKLDTATTGNPCLVTVRLDVTKGLFSGTFKLSDPKPGSTSKTTRTVSYSGILLKHLGQGYGVFQLPGLPSGTSVVPTKAGLVHLKQP